MTGMDLLDFVLVLVGIGALVLVSVKLLNVHDAANRYKAQKDAQISAQNRRNAEIKAMKERGEMPQARTFQSSFQEQEGGPVGSWVPELLQGFGIDPEVIFDEEMPADLKTFLPFIKAYVSTQGGLPGIMQKVQNQGTESPGGNEPI